MFRAVLVALLLAPGAALACEVFPQAPDSLAHSLVTGPDSLEPGGVLRANFDHPTSRYGHAVLGDTPEAGALFASSGDTFTSCGRFAVLADDRVFEDIQPRLADITGDGGNEVAVVESSLSKGAQLAVYDMVPRDGNWSLEKIAATPHIGRPYRWLAPAAIADFDGDGRNDIAYVETPHIGGTLRVWTMRDGELVQIASAYGFSNHRIGENFISGGLRDCGAGPEVVVMDAGWRRIIAAQMEGGEIATNDLGAYGADALADALACR